MRVAEHEIRRIPGLRGMGGHGVAIYEKAGAEFDRGVSAMSAASAAW